MVGSRRGSRQREYVTKLQTEIALAFPRILFI